MPAITRVTHYLFQNNAIENGLTGGIVLHLPCTTNANLVGVAGELLLVTEHNNMYQL